MVTVPTYQRNVQTRPALQQNLTVRASGEDFGAGIGRAAQSVASGLGQASQAVQAVQDLEDNTRAKEADNALAAWSRDALYGEGGYMTLSGSSAVEGRAAFEKSWEEQRKKIGMELSPGAARNYQTASVARRNSVYESVIVHSANERKKWVMDASSARVETFGQDALANFSDPKKVDFNIAAGQAELRQQAQLEGWGPDALALKEMEYISGVRQAITMRKALTDPLAAKAYADRYSDQLTGVAQASIAAALDVSVKDEQSKIEAARIMGIGDIADNSPTGRDEATAAAPLGSVEDQLAAIKDDDVRDLTRKRIAAMQTLQNSANEAAQKQAKKGAFDYIVQGGSPDDLPLEVKSAIGVEGMASLWTYFEKQASGAHTVSDPETVYTFTQYAAIDPAGFAKIDLNDIRGNLSPSDFKILMDKQASAIADARKAGEDGAPLRSAFSFANDALAGVGITTTGLKDGDLAEANKRIAMFQNVLAGQVAEFVDKEGRNPTDADLLSMVNRLLLPVVLKGPADLLNWGGKTRDAKLFEIGNRADNETVDVTVGYLDIPIDLRDAINADLEAELSRKPSPDEVTARYEEFLLGR